MLIDVITAQVVGLPPLSNLFLKAYPQINASSVLCSATGVQYESGGSVCWEEMATLLTRDLMILTEAWTKACKNALSLRRSPLTVLQIQPLASLVWNVLSAGLEVTCPSLDWVAAFDQLRHLKQAQQDRDKDTAALIQTMQSARATTGQSTLPPPECAVLSVCFSHDGSRIVSGSEDKTVRVWDALSGQPALLPLQGHEDAVTSVCSSPDGSRIASGSVDGPVRAPGACTGHSQEEETM
ncbi:hypothetical protein HWV62_44073 [Athelia sp. TMB]|nr:hypothetical protein HWV62_44073 [Athelia sp. TMB]